MRLRDAVRPDLPTVEIAAAVKLLGDAKPLAFRVGNDSITYRASGDAIDVADGAEDAEAIVTMSEAAWVDFVSQFRTFMNLYLAGELDFDRGGFEELAQWDPALRLLHAGIPVYDPGRADFEGLDPSSSLSLDSTDAELRRQLQTMGAMHVRGVFSADEMAAVNAEVDRLAEVARPNDDQSWWVTNSDDDQVLCRLVYASLRSEVLASFESDERILRLGRLLDNHFRVFADRMEGSSVLIKAPGETSGLSNIPWHQDCGMGGHEIMCPAVSIGIQITGSSAATGNLQVVPGSQGQTLHYRWEDLLSDVPVIEIDTAPGDVTVHIQDVMHASPKPTGEGGRRTFYVTFYPPKLADRIGPGVAFNDLVRNRTDEVASLQ